MTEWEKGYYTAIGVITVTVLLAALIKEVKRAHRELRDLEKIVNAQAGLAASPQKK